jgi:hypothetical protein
MTSDTVLFNCMAQHPGNLGFMRRKTNDSMTTRVDAHLARIHADLFGQFLLIQFIGDGLAQFCNLILKLFRVPACNPFPQCLQFLKFFRGDFHHG